MKKLFLISLLFSCNSNFYNEEIAIKTVGMKYMGYTIKSRYLQEDILILHFEERGTKYYEERVNLLDSNRYEIGIIYTLRIQL